MLCTRMPTGFCLEFLEGQGELVSGLVMGISKSTIWVIGYRGYLTYLLNPPDPPRNDVDGAHVAIWHTFFLQALRNSC